MKLSPLEIRKRILIKMVRHAWWGGKHTAYDNIPRGFPKDLWKDIRMALDGLIKEGLILTKPTGYGLHVSLNVHRKADIEQMVFPGDS
ncbi:MAG: hypothetical protein Q8P05_01145 [Candidatus Diapherotrites archaeon]|nr:hypothetical protein [Candidatus Diapherotrites archaeon]MDZ4256080.1 hypothetical protein [archaeon]